MRTKFVKILMAVLTVTMLSTGITLSAEATVAPTVPGETIAEAEDSGIMPLADVIVTKFRLNNGRRQYRRWNETQNRWVDPDWIYY